LKNRYNDKAKQANVMHKEQNETGQLESLKPIVGAARNARQRLNLQSELLLALLPTFTVLVVMALVEEFSKQRLLFASLAASAFLIYLDPEHGTNSTRSLVVSQSGAACIGTVAFYAFGPVYAAAATAMVVTIGMMIALDVVHPPAVATSLSFALRAGQDSTLLLFGLAVAMTAVLIVLQRITLRMFAYYARSAPHGRENHHGRCQESQQDE
jgi:CBS-domain-containing membrane protein